MSKKLTTHRTHSEHAEHMYRLWKIRAATWALFWAVVGHATIVLVLAVAGRVWR